MKIKDINNLKRINTVNVRLGRTIFEYELILDYIKDAIETINLYINKYEISTLNFIANEGDEPVVSAIFVGEGTGMGSGTQLSTISHLKKIDNDAYSYQQLTFNSIIYLTTTADPFKIQVKSGGDGTGSLSSGSYFSIARIR